MWIRWFALGLGVGLGLSACGAARSELTCTVATCAGCCDEHGCRTGTSTESCGRDGVICSVCEPNAVCSLGQCRTDGSAGGGSGGTGGGGGATDAGSDGCSEAAKLIYVLDQDRTLSSFNPQAIGNGPFTEVGRLSCPSQLGAEPFSMSVDRHAVAWVIFDSGELFTVDLSQRPLSCLPTSFAPQLNVAKFGMGFVSDTPGSEQETLFISGSPLATTLVSTKFGTLSTEPPYPISLRGTLTGAPELTGTGDAKLWAFFPDPIAPRVTALDKSSGQEMSPGFAATTIKGFPLAWAFAFWGGDFWIFLQRDVDPSTNVWRLNHETGAITNVARDTGRRIVGAGVSTCAPVTIN